MCSLFLNYFFAVMFIFCFLIGIFLNPFIIVYHSKQKKTFATIMFLLVSMIDQIKSFYLPLVLILKLLSPLDKDDYYYISPHLDFSLITWTSLTNKFLFFLSKFEMDLLVVLCVARYISIVYPLSSARKRNIVFSVVLGLSFLIWVSSPVIDYFQKPLAYVRVAQTFFPMNETYIKDIHLPLMYTRSGLNCLFIFIGGSFSVLTIRHLKNSDTASSEVSSRNIRKGILFMMAMTVLNDFVLISSVSYNVTIGLLENDDWKTSNTGLDCLQFSNIFVIPLIQSAFNSLSFLIICSEFRDFVKKLVRQKRVNITDQPTTAQTGL